jgi:ribonuclease HII
VDSSELQRLRTMSIWEENIYKKGYVHIAGVDEAGRGPLAGPVVASAVILPKGFLLQDLNDSKKVCKKRRGELFQELIHHPSVHFGIGIIDAQTIDRVNILQATFLAMQQALSQLSIPPDFVLIDGHLAPKISFPHKTLIGGDALSISIAAASIIAKETRDRIMDELHQNWPKYGFGQHKGYGTKKHLACLQELGPCAIHRFSFEPLKSWKKDSSSF